MEFKIANYGQDRDVNAEPEELEIFEILVEMSCLEDLALVRRSDNYVTAATGVADLARFKFTSRAKWINFPLIERGSAKHRFDAPEDVRVFSNEIIKSVEAAAKVNQNWTE